MVALDVVHASNARLRELGPDLVALFVGGTSGIGEFTLKAFVQNTISPRVYLVGRNASAADRIIKECRELNKEGKVEFLKADVTELKEVDLVCKEIQKREKKINLLFQTQGNLTLNGRNENPEGLDRKFTLNYYSRMRFVYNLLPQLRTASAEPPHFSRTLSVLGAGHEGAINLTDLDLKTTFSGARCAAHTIVMNDFMAEEFAAREHGISFLHTSPGVVNTGLTRELPIWARALMKVATPLLSLFFVSADETGQRQLFLASSGIYPPAKPAQGAPLAAGVPFPKDFSVSKGSNGKVGSGAYLVNWNGDISGNEKILSDYREKGVGKTVWEHTMGIFKQVEKINQGGIDSATS
ncbi:NAD(P)-binding protein [Hyaloscypha bicolor E]|uniref:NAD(P)-binding protein n=1 Tax=Hyaloscypha bicolor E TaxID=1095630 RepID=A0A2J6SIA0_9HELO|nr:NAD(P)-binding protein [Hyaloscypha bicolor E]PMD50483.1 NAD(P)-binding protein [Hyaloscypha bicolor E]